MANRRLSRSLRPRGGGGVGARERQPRRARPHGRRRRQPPGGFARLELVESGGTLVPPGGPRAGEVLRLRAGARASLGRVRGLGDIRRDCCCTGQAARALPVTCRPRSGRVSDLFCRLRKRQRPKQFCTPCSHRCSQACGVVCVCRPSSLVAARAASCCPMNIPDSPRDSYVAGLATRG